MLNSSSHRRAPRRDRTRKIAWAAEPLERRLMPSADVLTFHNDNARTGANLGETVLDPTTVNAKTFGKVGQVAVDGQVYAQPLVKTNVNVPGQGTHDVVFVATENDSVYAFDAGTLAPLWHDGFTNPAAGVTAVPKDDIHGEDIGPRVGITSTPVIDPATNTLYVVTFEKVVHGRSAQYVQQLHALDLGSGAEKFGGPTPVPGKGAGRVAFNAKIENQRPALLLDNGVVYLSWASFGDHGAYHGWVMGYNAQTLRRVVALNVTPTGSKGGIWMSGGGPAADANGTLFLSVGNGTFDPNPRGRNRGSSLLKLTPSLTVTDYFTPWNQKQLSAQDQDFGSGGVVLLPDQPGPHPHLLVTGGKEGTLYLLDRDNLGRFDPRTDHVVQKLPNALFGVFDTPAYFHGTVYVVGTPTQSGPKVRDTLKAFALNQGGLSAPTTGRFTYGYPGSTPSVSADGTKHGIVWTLDNGAAGSGLPAVLRADDAGDITRELYDSTQAGPRDLGGPAVKFAVPTVANGKVYVGGSGTLTAYGLLAAPRSQ